MKGLKGPQICCVGRNEFDKPYIGIRIASLGCSDLDNLKIATWDVKDMYRNEFDRLYNRPAIPYSATLSLMGLISLGIAYPWL